MKSPVWREWMPRAPEKVERYEPPRRRVTYSRRPPQYQYRPVSTKCKPLCVEGKAVFKHIEHRSP